MAVVKDNPYMALVDLNAKAYAKDGPLWRSLERVEELVLHMIKHGVILEDQAESTFDIVLKYAVERGFVEVDSKPGQMINPFTARTRLSVFQNYIKYISERSRTTREKNTMLKALGYSSHSILRWGEQYFGPGLLKQAKERGFVKNLILEMLKRHGPLSRLELREIVGGSPVTMFMHLKKLEALGKIKHTMQGRLQIYQVAE
jgi:DNA-binding Lrp family transcriptional regulator